VSAKALGRLLRIGYWLYLWVGSTAMLIVSSIAGEHLLIAISLIVVIIATVRCTQLLRNPDDD